MRGAARSPGSLLRFMRDEVPGVNTPMLYVGMTFSWFAWHVEDHDLHSLNYMHFGAAKTWYGVPRDAALAFEDVVREHGYGGEVNPLETFATLGKKTTVMSPEVLVGLGVPCCRLVQNEGDFVVTFPGSYHCGFSHGFNCGEASNIATPEWLRVAKEAAIRRASINRPPMLSHYQLLYELALSMCIRDPSIGPMEPRSSRLKEKKKGEGGQLVKKIFVQNAIEDNELLSSLLNDGSSCIILPINADDGPVLSALRSRSQLKAKSNTSDGLCSSGEALEESRCLSETFDRNGEIINCGALSSSKESPSSVCSGSMHDCVNLSCSSDTHNAEGDKVDVISAAGLLDQGLLSCVSCGILSFSCVAVIKPRECTSKYLMSSDYNLINDQLVNSGRIHPANATSEGTDGGILHSDEDIQNKKIKVCHDCSELSRHMTESQHNDSSHVCFDGTKMSSSSIKCQERPSSQSSQCIGGSGILNGPRGFRTRNKYLLKMALSEGFQPNNIYQSMEKKGQSEPSNSKKIVKEPLVTGGTDYDARCKSTAIATGDPRSSTATINISDQPIVEFDKDSSRMHVFCLEHAVEVEKRLQAIGGAHIILLCRPEYLKIEAEARTLAAEMKVEYDWKDIHFREANMEDRDMIQEVLQDEETIPTNSDWAVKLGDNLYYSANLAKSPIYNKQIPYNKVIYRAFGCDSPDNSPVNLKTCERNQGRQKKVVFAGRWCGRVWMSNQVHPYLARRIESHELEEIDNSSGVEVSKRIGSTITAVMRSSKKRENMILKETNSKRIKQTQECNSGALKGVAEVPSPSPAGVVLRVSSRIANRANKIKSEMTEEEDPAGRPKSEVTCPSRPGPSKQKTKVKAKNQIMPPTASLKDEKEHPSATKGSSVSCYTKQRTRTEAKEATGETGTPRDPKQEEYVCNIDGCLMSFDTKKELSLHKHNICPVKGCGKKFFVHRYLLQHRKVHTDDRPLKCPWEGCDVAFKWTWARTEHLRVHTGDRPYVCHEPGCTQTFRFVSDFSRHKRRTGHSTKKTNKHKSNQGSSKLW